MNVLLCVVFGAAVLYWAFLIGWRTGRYLFRHVAGNPVWICGFCCREIPPPTTGGGEARCPNCRRSAFLMRGRR
jgi:hypothetical protein